MARPTNQERERRRLLKEQGKWPEVQKKPVGRPRTKIEGAVESQPAKAGEISIKELEKEIQNDTRSVNPVSEEFNYSEDDVVVEDFKEENNVTENKEELIKETFYEEIEVPEDGSGNQNGEPDLADVNEDIPNDDFDPLKDPVKERDYTNKGANTPQGTTNPDGTTAPPIIEEPIPEPKINYNNIEDDFEKDKGKDGGGKGTSTGGGSSINKEPKREPVNQKLDDISPTQKRKAAEKTADAILLTYQQVAPMPFKWASKFNMRKLESMDMKGEIELNGVVGEDGTTAKEYCEHQNNKAEETFVITNEMKNDIKEPLVDVLMENNLALTPTQRLVMAVGTQVLQMGIIAGQNFMQNREAIKAFKEFVKEKHNLKEQIIREHETKKAREEQQYQEQKQREQKQAQAQAQKEKASASKKEKVKETNDDVDDDVKFTPPPSDFDDAEDVVVNENPKSTSPVVNEKVEVKKEGTTTDNKLDEYLTIANGGITVEEYIDEPNDDVI